MVESTKTSLPALVDYIAFAQDRELMNLIGNDTLVFASKVKKTNMFEWTGENTRHYEQRPLQYPQEDDQASHPDEGYLCHDQNGDAKQERLGIHCTRTYRIRLPIPFRK